MKFMALFLVAVMAIEAVDVAPVWVPEKYKKDFIEMVNACEDASKMAHEYSEILKSPSQVSGCEAKDKGVIFISKRGAVDVRWYAEFEKPVKSCELSGGVMTITFDGVESGGTFMTVLKYTAIIVGSVAIGVLMGR